MTLTAKQIKEQEAEEANDRDIAEKDGFEALTVSARDTYREKPASE